ncbi:MAG: aspartate/glutamate racemase family protein [Terriglobales bacterium]
MRALGLIGGTSWHSTVEYYRYINQAVNNVHGDNTNPPLILYNLNQQQMHALQLEDRWDKIADILTDAVRRLEAAGAGAVMLCANTPHKVYPEVARRSNVPILHIADATGRAIQSAGLAKVALIGTIYTMEGAFISGWLQNKYQVEVIVPSSTAARKELQRIIQQELALGIFKPETKDYVLAQIAGLCRRGAEGVILGCTEFPLIIGQSDLSCPAFNTMALHCDMAVDYILGR